MHELFLTASVNPTDFDTVCAILQGLTWMTARRSVYRVLYFAGQPQPTGLPKLPARGMLPRQQERQLWADLHKQLLRSSYILQAHFEVPSEADFGKEAPMDLPHLPATLRWTDLPDVLKEPQTALRKKNLPPAPNVPVPVAEPVKDSPIISRKKIDIPFSAGLVLALSENKQTYKNELIQEVYSFHKEKLEISLSRYYYIPAESNAGGRRPAPQLPAWDALRPVDDDAAHNKWVLNLKLNVSEDEQPENLAKAQEELMRHKTEFEKLFEFQMLDRRVFDTRIAPPPVIPGRGPPPG
ncbi:hypothetical protein F5Y17DRAFT_431976 [Xylariaceae sp. FL0594]|nr:hypothetical protein F5Y17DRAFT_431976 [Xylariaceae sp. FL0594]